MPSYVVLYKFTDAGANLARETEWFDYLVQCSGAGAHVSEQT